MLGLLIVDHGSRRGESNDQLIDMAQRVQKLRPNDLVEHAHLEVAEPTIAQAINRLVARGASEVRVLPYFLGDGRHTREDIPKHVTDAANTHAGLVLVIAPALGPHDALARLLLVRGEIGVDIS